MELDILDEIGEEIGMGRAVDGWWRRWKFGKCRHSIERTFRKSIHESRRVC